MKILKRTIICILLIILNSCGESCKDLPDNYRNYNEAKDLVLGSNFKIRDEADVSDSYWITSAKYYSCDNKTGYFIIEINDEKYIYQDMPLNVWNNFSKAKS